MRISMIVAASKIGLVIGKNNRLPWQKPIKRDLTRFRTLTLHRPVIMGRKTYESLPKRPLDERINIVISKNPEFKAPGAHVVSSLEDALTCAQMFKPDEVFIAGGETVYREALQLHIVERLYITLVDVRPSGGDAFFPKEYIGLFPKVITCRPKVEDGISFDFLTLECA